jgi:hypothetical protein
MLFGVIKGGDQGGIAEKRSGIYRLINDGDILGNDSACPQIEVPNFGVSHNAGRHADMLAAALQLCRRVMVPQITQKRGTSQFYGVSLFL